MPGPGALVLTSSFAAIDVPNVVSNTPATTWSPVPVKSDIVSAPLVIDDTVKPLKVGELVAAIL